MPLNVLFIDIDIITKLHGQTSDLMSKETKDKSFFAKWLDQLQQESWQMELLISGFAIFGLISMKPFIYEWMYSTMTNSTPDTASSSILVVLIVGVLIGWMIFLINLIIHVLLRGLWIGAIGLRYVSGDIDYQKLNYSTKITSYFKRKGGSFDDYIEKLEDISSVIFSYTFLLFFIFLSASIFFAEFMMIRSTLVEFFGLENLSDSKTFSTLVYTYLIGAAIVFIDFITLGQLKKIKQRHFSSIFLVLFRFYSAITLSFIWRPLLLNFIDNKYTKKLILIAIPYTILATIILPSFKILGAEFYPEIENISITSQLEFINENSFSTKYYENKWDYSDETNITQIGRLVLPSIKVNGPLGEVFINNHSQDGKLVTYMDSTLVPITNKGMINSIFSSISYIPDDTKTRNKQLKEEIKAIKDLKYTKEREIDIIDSLREASNQIKLNNYQENLIKVKTILKDAISISIDGNRINPASITCDYYIHTNRGEKGMLCFYPLDSLSIGRHQLKVGKVVGKPREQKGLDTLYTSIPFIYEGM